MIKILTKYLIVFFKCPLFLYMMIGTPACAANTSSTPNNGVDTLAIALNYLDEKKGDLGLSSKDVSDVIVTDQYVSSHNGVTHLYLRQRHNGIEVAGANININLTRDGKVLNVNNSFISNLNERVNADTPSLSAIQAVEQAAQHLGLTITEALVIQKTTGNITREVVLSEGGISSEPIPVKLMYQPINKKGVHLSWNMVLRLKDSAKWLNIRVDAMTGEMIFQNNWIDEASGAGSDACPVAAHGLFSSVDGSLRLPVVEVLDSKGNMITYTDVVMQWILGSQPISFSLVAATPK